jgi:hypothetical protein
VIIKSLVITRNPICSVLIENILAIEKLAEISYKNINRYRDNASFPTRVLKIPLISLIRLLVNDKIV